MVCSQEVRDSQIPWGSLVSLNLVSSRPMGDPCLGKMDSVWLRRRNVYGCLLTSDLHLNTPIYVRSQTSMASKIKDY